MTTTVALAVLAAALMHAGWNSLVKTGKDRLAATTIVVAFPGFALMPLLPFLEMPPAVCWPYIGASVAIHLVYNAALAHAYKAGDFAPVYGVARGGAPLLVALGAWLAAGEVPHPGALAGIVGICAGLWLLAGGAGRGALAPALMVAAAIAGYSVADGMGARLSPGLFSYIAWLYAGEAVAQAALYFVLHRRAAWSRLRAEFPRAAWGGVAAGTAYGIVLWAMTKAPLAQVSALRETSVVAAALIGAHLLGEPFGRRRLAAACVVAAGAAVLRLA